MNEMKRVLNVREAAALTGWSIHELYRRLVRGRIPGAQKMDGRWVIRATPLRRWLDGLDEPAKTAK
jgi:hypothetical protein